MHQSTFGIENNKSRKQGKMVTHIVDTNLYPINILDKESQEYIQFVDSIRAKYTELGIVTLPGFLKVDAIEEITKEIGSKSEKAWISNNYHNIFMDDGEEKLPNDHVRNRVSQTKVCYYFFPKRSPYQK